MSGHLFRGRLVPLAHGAGVRSHPGYPPIETPVEIAELSDGSNFPEKKTGRSDNWESSKSSGDDSLRDRFSEGGSFRKLYGLRL